MKFTLTDVALLAVAFAGVSLLVHLGQDLGAVLAGAGMLMAWFKRSPLASQNDAGQ